MVEKLGIEKNKIADLGNLLYKNYGTTMAGLRVYSGFFFLVSSLLLIQHPIHELGSMGFLICRQLDMILTMMNITGREGALSLSLFLNPLLI